MIDYLRLVTIRWLLALWPCVQMGLTIICGRGCSRFGDDHYYLPFGALPFYPH